MAVDPQRQMLIAAPVRLAYKYNLIKRTPQTETQRLFTKDGQPYWNENFQVTTRFTFSSWPLASAFRVSHRRGVVWWA